MPNTPQTHAATPVQWQAEQGEKLIPRRDRLIRLPEVETLTGCKKSWVYKAIGERKFPAPVRLGGRSVAWSETAVLQWVQDRVAGVQQ